MANNDWLEALHNNKPLAPLNQLLRNKARLNVALCYGCGGKLTRSEMAESLWRYGYVTHDCMYEYTVKPYRPLTLWEIIVRDKDSGFGSGVNPAALMRALYEVLHG